MPSIAGLGFKAAAESYRYAGDDAIPDLQSLLAELDRKDLDEQGPEPPEPPASLPGPGDEGDDKEFRGAPRGDGEGGGEDEEYCAPSLEALLAQLDQEIAEDDEEAGREQEPPARLAGRTASSAPSRSSLEQGHAARDLEKVDRRPQRGEARTVVDERQRQATEEARRRALVEARAFQAAEEERRRAEAEARAFEERRRREAEEAAARAAEARRRRAEAAAEAWERQCMAAEEAAERERRAGKASKEHEELTRRRVEAEAAKRRRAKQLAKEADRQKRRELLEQRRKEKEQRREQRRVRKLQKAQEKVRRMAENGYAWTPQGWVRLDWMSGGPDVAEEPDTPSEASSPEPEDEVSEAEEEEAMPAEPEGDAVDAVVDQRPDRSLEVPEVAPLEEILEDLDRTVKQAAAAGEEVPPLEVLLEVLNTDELRHEAASEASAVKESFTQLGHVETSTEPEEGETLVLRVAKEKRPDLDWNSTVAAESAYKPFNDFVEEKQEGTNSFEERQARSAAIQAKLQAARNRLSLVRWQPVSERGAGIVEPRDVGASFSWAGGHDDEDGGPLSSLSAPGPSALGQGGSGGGWSWLGPAGAKGR